MTNERLTYPIAQVPLETVREGGTGAARLPGSPAFWIGFAICTVLYVQQRLPEIYPIRYGGLRLYQRMVPAAIGVIVADATCQMIAAVVLWLAR